MKVSTKHHQDELDAAWKEGYDVVVIMGDIRQSQDLGDSRLYKIHTRTKGIYDKLIQVLSKSSSYRDREARYFQIPVQVAGEEGDKLMKRLRRCR